MRTPSSSEIERILGRIKENSQNYFLNNIKFLKCKWENLDEKIEQALTKAHKNEKTLTIMKKILNLSFDESIETIKECFQALCSSIKMIHKDTESSDEHKNILILLQSFSDQLIELCKNAIEEKYHISECTLCDADSSSLSELISTLQWFLQVNEIYHKEFETLKNELNVDSKESEFEYFLKQTFRNLDTFCFCIVRIIKLFTIIRQSQELTQHDLEGIKNVTDIYNSSIVLFNEKCEDLLNSDINIFNEAFYEFCNSVPLCHKALLECIEKNLESFEGIEDALKVLYSFRNILKEEDIRSYIEIKDETILKNTKGEVGDAQTDEQRKLYISLCALSFPEGTNEIPWSQYLYRMINYLQTSESLFKWQESQDLIYINYTKSHTVLNFEEGLREAWFNEIEKAASDLVQPLIIKSEAESIFYVNFNPEILTLIREAKCLLKIGVEIPEKAKEILHQEGCLKRNSYGLQIILCEYNHFYSKIKPVYKSLLMPLLDDLEVTFQPGMENLKWISEDVEQYITSCHEKLKNLEGFINQINNVVENEIECKLKNTSKIVLADLPEDSQSFTTNYFIETQEKWKKCECHKLKIINIEVENSVDKLIELLSSYCLGHNLCPINPEESPKLVKYYNWHMYQALLQLTRQSLRSLKNKLCGTTRGTDSCSTLLFDCCVSIDVTGCIISPSINDLQKTVNLEVSAILKCTKEVYNWGQQEVPENEKTPFYDWIIKDKEIIKLVLLLTGALQGLRPKVTVFMEQFSQYKWLWIENPEENEECKEKIENLPNLEWINNIPDIEKIGALKIETTEIKRILTEKVIEWKKVCLKQ
ncbi:unnamed protein product [Moneuplotes crassus]|uniref:Dynein heavy chain tail domain-containing protein n=1 Tax=Euplotes crassus TaxID=5936 RepID=A0AAD1XXF1_EUPCR|nr:unnamed protein product [Moneuplotes crassus]